MDSIEGSVCQGGKVWIQLKGLPGRQSMDSIEGSAREAKYGFN